ncbi:hypothetical protein IFM89_032249, partial [Coptis chinensis]
IALLQPTPETYDLFNDIILVSDGQIVYQGPWENVLEFFEAKGFRCPERKGVANFLQEVTSRKDQHQYWANKDEPYSYVSTQEFADTFQSFHVGRKQGQELNTPFDKRKRPPYCFDNFRVWCQQKRAFESLIYKGMAADETSEYGVSKKELLKACFSREWLLMKRNSSVYIFKMMQVST